MTQEKLDTGELVDVMVRLAADQEPPLDSGLVRDIIHVESAYIENRATARDRVASTRVASTDRTSPRV